MKKHVLTFCMLLLCTFAIAQTAVEVQKAKSSVKAYLIRTLNNPASYTPSSWGKLEKTFTAFEDTKKVRNIDEILESYKKGKDALQDKILDAQLKAKGNYMNGDYKKDSTYIYYTTLQQQVLSSTDSLTALRSSLQKTYKPISDGYSIEHSFRARNKFNALVLQNYIFVFNKGFKIISSGDTDEIERERQDLQRRIDELTKGVN